MPDHPPLKEAAATVRSHLDDRWSHDSWPTLACLYAGAILQLRHKSPRHKIELHSLKNGQLQVEATRPLQAHGLLQKIADEILDQRGADRLSSMARDVIQKLGALLFARISFLLHIRPGIAEGEDDDPCMVGEIGGVRFRLAPSIFGGGVDLSEEPLKHRLMAHLPDDGWEPQHQKVLPRYVRVLGEGSLDKTKVRYLETVDPDANRRLAEFYGSNGLTLAAIPLHPLLTMKMVPLGDVHDGELFRFNEHAPGDWPEGWKKHLESALESCVENKVAAVVLPELMGSPAVINACDVFIKNSAGQYPVLLFGGSWHTDDGEVFYNRTTIYSCTAGEGLTRGCVHDKFSQFVFKGHVEGNRLGTGFTYLITSVGVMAVGICRDWFFGAQTDGGHQAIRQLSEMAPIMAIAPSMTTDAADLHHSVSDFFRRERCLFIFSNACGQMKELTGKCCADRQGKDIRSFVASPRKWYSIIPLCGSTSMLDKGVEIVNAPCANQNTNANTAAASIRLEEKWLRL